MKYLFTVILSMSLLISNAQDLKSYQVRLQTKGGVRSIVVVHTTSLHQARIITKKTYPTFTVISIKLIK